MSADDRERDRRRVERKTAFAARRRDTPADAGAQKDERLPPGQTWAHEKWPILDLGDQPEISRRSWRLCVDGLVEEPLTLDFDGLVALGEVETADDFHCVTSWSTQGNRWKGVRFVDLMERALPSPEAAFVLFESSDTAPDTSEFYTTNLPLAACLDPSVLLVHSWNDRPLEREHGGPVRMFVPKRYAWKSAKWLKKITLLERDRPGYWEVRGYSNSAKPWEDDRYGRPSLLGF